MDDATVRRYVQQAVQQAVAAERARWESALSALRAVDAAGAGAQWHPGGLRGQDHGLMRRTFPWGSDHPWGLISIDGMDVTIAAGRFLAGPDLLLTTAETTLTIEADASYVGLEYNLDARALSVIGPQADEPKWEDGYWRTWLYFFAMPAENVVQYVRHNLTGTWGGGLFSVAREPPS